jgi:hypothetical protein
MIGYEYRRKSTKKRSRYTLSEQAVYIYDIHVYKKLKKFFLQLFLV